MKEHRSRSNCNKSQNSPMFTSDDENYKMNIRDPREGDIPNKQENGGFSNDKTPSSSRLWCGHKNPRIVRVSKLFGGKDRHSKVTTVRGLRDRRVRLSVPTAVQLYDLQDRLGLGQPSKVVDWLLNQAQHEIDKLPPLQIPQGGFIVPSIENGACSLALSTNEVNQKMLGNAEDVANLGKIRRSIQRNFDETPRTKQREVSNYKENITEEGDHEVGFPYASHYYWDPSNSYLSNLNKNNSEAEVTGIHSSISNSNSSLIMPLMPGSNHLPFYSSGIVQSVATPYMDLLQESSKRQQFDNYLQNMPWIAHSSSSTMRFLQSNFAENNNFERQNGD